jgi:hypothetical protein
MLINYHIVMMDESRFGRCDDDEKRAGHGVEESRDGQAQEGIAKIFARSISRAGRRGRPGGLNP